MGASPNVGYFLRLLDPELETSLPVGLLSRQRLLNRHKDTGSCTSGPKIVPIQHQIKELSLIKQTQAQEGVNMISA